MDFAPISLAGQVEYLDQLTASRTRASDYSFINLWGWNDEYGLEWSWTDGLVWLKQRRPEPAYWAPVGDWRSVDWPSLWHRHVSPSDRFVRIPEPLLKIWREVLPNHFEASATRGQWDYVYDAHALRELKGNRYHKKKNLVNQFVRAHDFCYRPLGPETVQHALAMQNDWCAWRDCEASETLAAENRAIVKVLQAWQQFKRITGGAIIIGEEMPAYTIAEKYASDMLLIHFEKGSPGYKGVYQAINQQFLLHSDTAFTSVNREQDLDNDGLRQAKTSYHPIKFIRKYQVTAL